MADKYSHIDFTPPEGVRKEAEKGLAWRREHGRGGTAVGIARARDLSNGTKLSPSTIRRMKAYFDRHEIDKQGEGWSPGDKGFPSNGRIAWSLWGADAGWAYARKVVEQMNAADEKEGRSLRPFGSTQGIKPKVFVVHGAPASGKTSYVMQHKGDNDVVFDFDKVMSALSGLPPHQKNENLISYCTDIRSLIIKRALRSPKVDRTWIIATNVGGEMKGQLSDIPVEYIHIDTPKEECLKRIEEDPERQPVAKELREAVERYFSPEQRSAAVQPNVERRFLGNFSDVEKADPDLLRVEKRADPSTGQPQTYLIGYAARFGKESLLLGDFVERIDPAAFDIVEKRQDSEGRPLETRCLFNHDPNHLLGRFPTTMKMTVDEKGLRYECLLPESRKDIEELCRRGDLKGSSFSFVVAEGGEKWSYDEGRSVRLVTKIKSLLDCGPVTYPAYGDATVAVAKRSYEQHIAAKSGHAESRNAIKAKAAEELAKTKAFLAERRGFCPTGQGGGIDNSCGAGGKGGNDNIEAAKKAKDKYDESVSTPKGAAAAGAAIGAAVGLIGGIPGVIAGSLTGAAFGALHAMVKGRLGGLSQKMGISGEQLSSAAKHVFGDDKKPFAIDGKTIGIESGDSIALISGKNPFTKEEGTSFHFQPGADVNGSVNIASVEKAAKSVSAKTVSVEAWHDKDVKSLTSKGYKQVAKSPGGSSSSKGVYQKSLSKTSKRSIDVVRETTEFLKARRR